MEIVSKGEPSLKNVFLPCYCIKHQSVFEWRRVRKYHLDIRIDFNVITCGKKMTLSFFILNTYISV